MASYTRALTLRPARRREAATRPNARAACASKGSGTKSASACWRWAWRTARSSSLDATSGPTESSARVTVVIWGSAGRHSAFRSRGSRMRVFVSSIPRACWTGSVTATDPQRRRYRLGASPRRSWATAANASTTSPPGAGDVAAGAALRPDGRRALSSMSPPWPRVPEPSRRGFGDLVSSRSALPHCITDDTYGQAETQAAFSDRG